jgi:hypothetical protein
VISQNFADGAQSTVVKVRAARSGTPAKTP